MRIYDSKIWISDLDEVISYFPVISELEGKTILITGVSGLVCSSLADVLIRYNETHEKKIRIIAAGRSWDKIKNRFGIYSQKDYFVYLPYDASNPNISISMECDYVVHGAGNSSPTMIVKEPVETMMSNFIGIKSLLDYAQKTKVKRVLYISSSEIYGKTEKNVPIKEEEYGYIELLNYRNSYSIGKRAAETMCVAHAAEYGTQAVIVRPGHVYGPSALPEDSHVSSSWAFAALRGEDIIMKSEGSQIRSYCYCLDCASAIITVLLKGKNCKAYNISNPNSIISIRQMGEIIAKATGVKLRMDIPSENERIGYNPMNNSSLNSMLLYELGWMGLFDANRGFSHTLSILKDKLEREK